MKGITAFKTFDIKYIAEPAMKVLPLNFEITEALYPNYVSKY